MYIPYLPEFPEDYLSVEGLLLDQSPLAVYQAKNVSECSALCGKTFFCSSFYAINSGGNCTLHASNDFRRSQGFTGLHISIDDIFPKKRYLEYQVCPIKAAFAEFNTKTHQRCQILCDDDLGNCAAFTFQAFQSHDDKNCKLFDRIAIIDELFEDKKSCEETGVSVAYATKSFVENTLKQFQYTEVASVQDLLADECKSLCLFDVDCVTLQYSTFDISTNSSLCSVGYLSAGTRLTDDFDEDEILVLEARSSDIGSQYFATPACYSGERLDVPNPTTVNRAYGYVRWPKACTSATPINNGNVDRITSPADCGLRCDQEDDCGGFIYYVNYTGSSNIDKIGNCELVGGEINVGVCDAVERNTDVYLRADLGSLCEAACNVHHLCSLFAPRVLDATSGEVECELYSDIALLDTCPENQVKTSVHIGLSYRERDAFVAAKDQCFVEFEDIALIGCYGPSFPTDSFNLTNSLVTPYHCQQHCRALDAPYYAVSDGTDCYCSSSSSFYSDLALSSSNCTTPCDGDPSQVCSAQ